MVFTVPKPFLIQPPVQEKKNKQKKVLQFFFRALKMCLGYKQQAHLLVSRGFQEDYIIFINSEQN